MDKEQTALPTNNDDFSEINGACDGAAPVEDGSTDDSLNRSHDEQENPLVQLPPNSSNSGLESASFDLVLGNYRTEDRVMTEETSPNEGARMGSGYTEGTVAVPAGLQTSLHDLKLQQLPVVLPDKMGMGVVSLNQYSHLAVGGSASNTPSSSLLSSAPLTGASRTQDPPAAEDSKEYGIPAHVSAAQNAQQDTTAVMVAAGALRTPVDVSARWPIWQVVLLAVIVGCEYGVASTTISLSGRLLGKAHWNVAMQLNTVGRVVGCMGIIAIEALRGKLSRSQDGVSLLDARGWAIAFVSAMQTGIYIAVHFLASSGNVSVLLALTSLYNIVPPLYGIVRGGEIVTKPKLAGFAAAALAVALLSAASATGGGGGEPSTISPLLQGLLVAVAIIGWGATDTIFSRIGKSMPSTSTAMWYAIGNAAFSIVLSQFGAAMRQITHDPQTITATPTAPGEDEVASVYGYFALFGTNIVAMAGWYGFITLGRVADASTFVPIVAAILTVTPSIIGTVFLGESFTAIMGAGVACAVISAVCMSLQRSAPGGSISSRASSFDEDPKAKADPRAMLTPSASLLSLAGALAPPASVDSTVRLEAGPTSPGDDIERQ